MMKSLLVTSLILTIFGHGNVLSAQEGSSSSERNALKNKSRIDELARLIGEVEMALMASPALLDELTVVPQQVDDLKPVLIGYRSDRTRLEKDFAVSMMRIEEKAKNGIPFNDDEWGQVIDFQTAALTQLDQTLSRVKEILLPHQIRRIRQIESQRRALGSHGPFNSFEIPLRLAADLELDQAETAELIEATDKARQELERRTIELKQAAWDSILDTLPAEKRAEFHRMVGEIRSP